ncbi:ImmA/IrrE family metallo-endopeptidase [Candidatus Poribacteria bacterium]|nr:ImmA/IrrE family metallo-endopeptidase [Candidatus Poribacteria bacterium]
MLGERLKRFRVARGMSLADLEIAIDHLVSSSTLSKYEKGTLQPSAKTLNQIASALGIKSAQLWGEPPCDVEPIAFRKLTKLGKKEQKRIKAFVIEELEKRVWLQEQISEQNTLELPILGTTVKNLDDAEGAAYSLRNTLNLGIDPIGNLMSVLEDHGIYIVEVNTSESFDGIFAIARDANDKVLAAAIAIRSDVPGDRQRLNLTHELGHLILDVNENVDPEKAAFRFGAAFLAPAEQLRKDVGQKRKRFYKKQLFELKKRYGMSIQAILYRLKDLEIITEEYYEKWCIKINTSGWRKSEPIHIPSEKPKRFSKQVCRALSDELITERDAERLLNQTGQLSSEKSLSERRQFLALPKKKKNRILSEQAKEMADFYENDTEWQEWEGGPVEHRHT